MLPKKGVHNRKPPDTFFLDHSNKASNSREVPVQNEIKRARVSLPCAKE